jgi:undecaprenyl pyrophosphate phosphatase UppP
MPGEEPLDPFRQMPMARQVGFWLFAGLIVLAAIFYLWWGFAFGVWIDNGLYAVVIVLVLFGLSGMWLMLPDPPQPTTTVPKG